MGSPSPGLRAGGATRLLRAAASVGSGGGWGSSGSGSLCRAGLDLDGAVVAVDDLFDDGQPEPRAHLSGGLGLFRTKNSWNRFSMSSWRCQCPNLHRAPEHFAIALQPDRYLAPWGVYLMALLTGSSVCCMCSWLA